MYPYRYQYLHCVYLIFFGMSSTDDDLPRPHEVEQIRYNLKGSAATTADNSVWIFSPKLNGFRALWDMNKKRMFSRNKKRFVLPNEFVAEMPSMKTSGFFLDGELVYDPRDVSVEELLASQPSRVAAQANFEMLNALVRKSSDSAVRSDKSENTESSAKRRKISNNTTLTPRTHSGSEYSSSNDSVLQITNNESRSATDWKFVRYFVFDIFYNGENKEKKDMVLRDRILMLKRIYDAMAHTGNNDKATPKSNANTSSKTTILNHNHHTRNRNFVLMPYYHYNPLCHSQYMSYAASKDHEGIVIRDTASVYRDSARSMLKDRVFRETSGEVSGVNYNKGGIYLLVTNDKGMRVKVRVANPDVTPIPSNGTLISFRYHTMTPRGAYMNAVYNGASSKI